MCCCLHRPGSYGKSLRSGQWGRSKFGELLKGQEPGRQSARAAWESELWWGKEARLFSPDAGAAGADGAEPKEAGSRCQSHSPSRVKRWLIHPWQAVSWPGAGSGGRLPWIWIPVPPLNSYWPWTLRRTEKEAGVRFYAQWNIAEGFYIEAMMEFYLYFRKMILAGVLKID